MKLAIFILAILAVGFALAETSSSVFDYTKLPTCALKCRILQLAETGCIPPDAPSVNHETYVSCLCQSEHLKSLHSSGEMCYFVCGADDSLSIRNYYNDLCSTPVPEPSSSSVTTTMPTSNTNLLSTTAINLSSATATVSFSITTMSPPTSSVTIYTNTTASTSSHRPKQGSKGFFDSNNPWRQIVLTVALTCVLTALGIFLFVYLRRPSRHSADIERPRPRSRTIPLQVLVPSIRSRPNLHEPEPRTPTTDDYSSLDFRPPTYPAASHPPSPSRSFASSLRFYADDLREEEENRRRRGSLISHIASDWQSASMNSLHH